MKGPKYGRLRRMPNTGHGMLDPQPVSGPKLATSAKAPKPNAGLQQVETGVQGLLPKAGSDCRRLDQRATWKRPCAKTVPLRRNS